MYEELVKALRDDNACLSVKTLHESADAIEELEKALNAVNDAHNEGYDVGYWAGRRDYEPKWIPVTERLPENDVHVLLSCKCGAGAYVCDGFYTEKFSTPTQFYEDIDADYDEETDEYYFPEGWWEVIKNWDDYSCVAIEDAVTHWMPLPEPPKEET